MFAARNPREALRQPVEGGELQAEGFDRLAAGKLLNHAGQLLDVATQAAEQVVAGQYQAEQGAGQGQQGGDGQYHGGNGQAAAGRARGEIELPVGVADIEAQRLRIAGTAALQQNLRGPVAELLAELDLPGLFRHGREGAEQAFEIDHQQQGALQLIAAGGAQCRGAVDQPAFADLVGLDGRLLAIFQAAQHVQRGEIHRAAAADIQRGACRQVDMGIDHALPVLQAALGGADQAAVAALQRGE